MRPYPRADRALQHLRHTQAVYQYGRYPQRHALGMMPPLPEGTLIAHITAIRAKYGAPTQEHLTITDGRSFFADREGDGVLDEDPT